MDNELVKNTLKFSFPLDAQSPSLVETARFLKSLDVDLESMETSYKVSEERCLFVKFKSLKAMKEAQEQNPQILPFRCSNGTKIEVKMEVAGSFSKYVRIFDLPPEIPDSEIAAVLGRYGSVKRMVKEKFPPELELNLFTGVRGVYLEVKKEIPASLIFLNRRGRIYYEGLKQKCFLCKKEGHLKVDCPQNNRKENATDEPQNVSTASVPSTSKTSFSDVLSTESSEDYDEPMELNTTEGQSISVDQVNDCQTSQSSQTTTTALEKVDKSTVKRQHPASDLGETDEDTSSNFKHVESRKSSRRAKISPNPLEVIISVPKPEGAKKGGNKTRRSTSK